MESDDEDVYTMPSECAEDVQVKKRQLILKDDLIDVKKSIASMAGAALRERSGCSHCSTCSSTMEAQEITYAEVQNTVNFLVNEVAKNENKKSAAEQQLEEVLRNNSEYCLKLTALVTKVEGMECRWSQLENDVTSMSHRVNSIEQYGRLYNLIIKNLKYVPNCTGTEFSLFVVRLINRLLGQYLFRPVLPTDIDKSHPLYQKNNGDHVIIVRFTCRDVRDDIYYKRRFLSKSDAGKGIFIYENLTKANLSLLRSAKKKLGASNVQTDQGKIIANINNSKTVIRSQTDIDNIFNKAVADYKHHHNNSKSTANTNTTNTDNCDNETIDVFHKKTMPALLEIIHSREILKRHKPTVKNRKHSFLRKGYYNRHGVFCLLSSRGTT